MRRRRKAVFSLSDWDYAPFHAAALQKKCEGIMSGDPSKTLDQTDADNYYLSTENREMRILLKQIQDALVEAFYDPDPCDPTPEVDYAVVDWVGVIHDARKQIDKLKDMINATPRQD